jgi:glucose-6-phosphate-specific signal transduction histidine kinase
MNLIATALSLPNAINLKPDLEKISYVYQSGLNIIIRLTTLDSLIYNTFWYTNTKTYNNKLIKLLKNHNYTLTKDSLINNENNIKVNVSSEIALCKILSTILKIKIDPQLSKRTSDYAEIIENNYKIEHRDNISKISKKSISK